MADVVRVVVLKEMKKVAGADGKERQNVDDVVTSSRRLDQRTVKSAQVTFCYIS
jgi:hypothetical protein